MKKLQLSPKATTDLDGIWTYTVEQWDTNQAEAYLRNLDGTFQLLRQFPELGRSIEHIRKGYQQILSASHIVVYRITGEKLEIMRVLHKNMDVPNQLRN
jgi:toxin ParE1/3/4